MKEGKLLYLLKHLSEEEFKGLKKVVLSPFFNTNERIVSLYNSLRPHFPSFENSERFRKKVFKKVYPTETYHHHKLHKLFSAFSQIIERYLLILEQDNNDLVRQKSLIRIFSKRDLKPLFDRETQLFNERLASFPNKNLSYYQNQIFLNDAIYFHPQKDKYDLKDESLDLLMDSLDKYFSLAKMRYGVSLKSRERILNKPTTWRFIESINAENEKDFLEKNLLFQLYQQAFLLLEENEKADFFAFEKLLFEQLEFLQEDAKILFFSGLNHVNRLINRGQTNSRKAFEWYRLGLKQGLFLENKIITEVTFCNIVITGCSEKEFHWVANFMKEYAESLEEKHRNEVLAYNQGLWHFYQKEFEKVLSVYFNYSFSLGYTSRTRLTIVRALFELFLHDNQYYEVLIANIKAFEVFINRDKKYAASKLKPHLNCIQIIKKFATLIINNYPTDEIKNWLNSQLVSKEKIIGRAWLIEKRKQLAIKEGS